ncbi:Aste57867_12470 [Aphanomyces stellatus]|uniref:Aste57867_12470 protein n=1 Tax=Aphanomyces stellatus TaxID=120398 RepID=A0A485KXM3_9STRA|nr:hypothetical protein As57867_012424 [Aphanomyces stellatus]VFT89321.1 Aste57867_12470 [Aphanomyces stellatus]
MCIAFFRLTTYKDAQGCIQVKLIVVDNRDEFYERATSRLRWWDEPFQDILARKLRVSIYTTKKPSVIVAQDMQRGGTWLGVRRCKDHTRVAFLTNIRKAKLDLNKESRGNLITDFLQSDLDVAAYVAQLKPVGHKYGGLNLVFFDGESLGYYCNDPMTFSLLECDVLYGLSNSVLENPWIKVQRGKDAVARVLASHDAGDDDDNSDLALCRKLLPVMADATRVEKRELLPPTGCSEAFEYQVSSIFVEPLYNSMYGTRTTIAMVLDGAHGCVLERDLNASTMEWVDNVITF